MYRVKEFEELLIAKGFSKSEDEKIRRINPNREVYMLGMEGGNTKYITELSGIVVIDTSSQDGSYTVEYSVYRDTKVNVERGRATSVERVLELRGNFDEYGEPLDEVAIRILEILGS